MRGALPIAAAVVLATTASAASPTVEQLLGRLPHGASAVIAVDVAALRTQPTVQHWLLDSSAPWSGIDNDATAFLRDAGLDPVRDVDLLVIGLTPGESEGGSAVVLAAGRYDPAAVGLALEKHGAEKTTVAGLTAYRANPHEGGEHAPLLVHATDDLVVAGAAAAVAAALGPAGGPSPLVTEAIQARHVDLKAPFWMVVEVPQPARAALGEAGRHAAGAEPGALADVVRATAAVKRVAVSGWLGDTLTLHSVAVATSDENAGLLRDAIKGALAAARLEFQQRDPRLVEPLRDAAVTVSGSVVEVKAAVPVALLDDLCKRPDARSGPPQNSR